MIKMLPLLASNLQKVMKPSSFKFISRQIRLFPTVLRTPSFGARMNAKLGARSFMVFLGAGSGISATLLLRSRVAVCEAKQSALIKRADSIDKKVPRDEVQLRWKELLALLGPEWFGMLVAIVSAFAVAILNIHIPLYLGDIVDVLSKFAREPGDRNYMAEIMDPVKKIVMAYLAQGAGTFIYISSLSALGERIAARLRRKLFEALITQDMEFYDRSRSGELLDRLTSDVQDFKSSFKLCISQGLRSVTQTVGSIGALYYLSPKLTAVMVVVVPSIVGVGAAIGSALRFLSRRAQAQTAKATAVADEAIGNIRTVKAFAMEQQEIRLFHSEIDLAAALYSRLGLGIAAFQGLSNVALNGIVLGVLYVGGLLMARSELPAGDLMSFLVATQTIQRSLGQMSLLFGQVIRGYSAGARVMEYIHLHRPLDDSAGGLSGPVLRPSVRFEGVTFRYPTRRDQTVLDALDLDIPEGAVVAICGPSGAGKSTVVALLERFYDPDRGRILIGGRDIRSLNPRWLRSRLLGLISQEPQLFHASVRENIRYGRPGATDAEVEAAARLANAHAFVTAFPAGYDTVVGERGTKVSGGQKQRIAIARALIKNPAVLVLDEATSALDAESERTVQEALDRVMRNRTVIVVAHRLSTIRNADLIVVMARGRVVEKGTHAQLMRNQGLYRRLVEGQEFGE